MGTSPNIKGRASLFDDAPKDVASVPGNLHHASDEHIGHLMGRMNPIVLVRQLAQDLAQRDAQMTELRRKAEERERVLRRMLQECEVSNMDIETRLRTLERSNDKRKHMATKDGVKAKKSEQAADVEGTRPHDSLEQRLTRALEDHQASHGDEATLTEEDSLLGYPATDGETDSVDMVEVHSNGSGDTAKNWTSYLWKGNLTVKKPSRAPSMVSLNEAKSKAQTRSRASTGAGRKPLSNELFTPPGSESQALPALRRFQSSGQVPRQAEHQPRKSSASVASWALKLVAGSSQSDRDSVASGTLRGNSPGTRDRSVDSANTAQSAGKASGTLRGKPTRSNLGPNGTVKGSSSDAARNAPASLAPASQPQLPRRLSNSGPVEMDRFVPEESRPPTLVQQRNLLSQNNEYLTDSFGFIYDQRRRKRQSEAAAAALRKPKHSSKVESIGSDRAAFDAGIHSGSPSSLEVPPSHDRPVSSGGSINSAEEPSDPHSEKKWYDFLKLATFPTELLSHTPATAPITTVDIREDSDSPPAKAPAQILGNKRPSAPSLPALTSNPEPLPTRVVSAHAEFTSPAASMPTSPATAGPGEQSTDPVRALLQHAREIHETAQRDKTVKWNEFLRKVRAERKREGEAAAAEGRSNRAFMPETLLTDGEIIGVAGLGMKGKIGRAKWKELKILVLGGIPVSLRPKIWAECSGATTLRQPGYYDDIVSRGDDDPTIVNQIKMDITRTLTDNIFFRRGPGVQKLDEVLLAYSRRNKEVGYCQGMNLITASLLIIMPTAEDAFWMLATMIEEILPQNYYDHSLLTSRADQQVLRQYVAELLPKLSQHLEDLGIELEALTFQWFLSVFTDCLSAEALYRVWDVVFCMRDGSTFLFLVALALLKLNEKELLSQDNPAAVYHYINHQMTNHAISIDDLIRAADALRDDVKRQDIETRRKEAVEREQEIMREREAFRLERIKSRGSGTKVPAPDITPNANVNGEEEPPGLRSTANGAEEADGDEELETPGEMQIRTPMPIEEDATFRA